MSYTALAIIIATLRFPLTLILALAALLLLPLALLGLRVVLGMLGYERELRRTGRMR